jgi:hypothetical protein
MHVTTEPQTKADPRTVPTLAKALFRQLREQGLSSNQIISLSSELIDMVSTDMRRETRHVAE